MISRLKERKKEEKEKKSHQVTFCYPEEREAPGAPEERKETGLCLSVQCLHSLPWEMQRNCQGPECTDRLCNTLPFPALDLTPCVQGHLQYGADACP